MDIIYINMDNMVNKYLILINARTSTKWLSK